MADLPELIVRDVAAWQAWLEDHHGDPTGVRLVLAKKGTVEPTSLTYDEALDEALCQGWIDGRIQRRDESTFRRSFTPRRSRSPWSRRNVGIVERLVADGRMRHAGMAAVDQAKADGRWERAYAGQADIEVPADLAAALGANPDALVTFEKLSSQNRYAILHRVDTAKQSSTRARRVEQFVAMLSRGETLHPQGQPTTGRRGG